MNRTIMRDRLTKRRTWNVSHPVFCENAEIPAENLRFGAVKDREHRRERVLRHNRDENVESGDTKPLKECF